MCGRIEILTYEEVASVVEAVEEMRRKRLERIQRGQACPGDSVLLFGRDNNASGLRISEANWGFLPEWSKQRLFNTRIESAIEGSSVWREAVQDGRCVIPAAAFFEPHATETERSPKTGRTIKRQYRFELPGDQPLLLAGVQAQGNCSVVTCEPNRWVSPIHNRMPLILRFNEVETWLSPDWTTLADRSGIELEAQPERPDSPAEPDQLSLF